MQNSECQLQNLGHRKEKNRPFKTNALKSTRSRVLVLEMPKNVNFTVSGGILVFEMNTFIAFADVRI